MSQKTEINMERKINFRTAWCNWQDFAKTQQERNKQGVNTEQVNTLEEQTSEVTGATIYGKYTDQP